MNAAANAPDALVTPPAASGFGSRIAVSIVTFFGLLIFILLYLAFWASLFNGLQSAVVIIAAILVFIAANGAAWASWGVRRARPHW